MTRGSRIVRRLALAVGWIAVIWSPLGHVAMAATGERLAMAAARFVVRRGLFVGWDGQQAVVREEILVRGEWKPGSVLSVTLRSGAPVVRPYHPPSAPTGPALARGFGFSNSYELTEHDPRFVLVVAEDEARGRALGEVQRADAGFKTTLSVPSRLFLLRVDHAPVRVSVVWESLRELRPGPRTGSYDFPELAEIALSPDRSRLFFELSTNLGEDLAYLMVPVTSTKPPQRTAWTAERAPGHRQPRPGAPAARLVSGGDEPPLGRDEPRVALVIAEEGARLRDMDDRLRDDRPPFSPVPATLTLVLVRPGAAELVASWRERLRTVPGEAGPAYDRPDLREAWLSRTGTRLRVMLLRGDEDVEQWLSFRKAAAR